jgi:hypothetical protein
MELSLGDWMGKMKPWLAPNGSAVEKGGDAESRTNRPSSKLTVSDSMEFASQIVTTLLSK